MKKCPFNDLSSNMEDIKAIYQHNPFSLVTPENAEKLVYFYDSKTFFKLCNSNQSIIVKKKVNIHKIIYINYNTYIFTHTQTKQDSTYMNVYMSILSCRTYKLIAH